MAKILENLQDDLKFLNDNPGAVQHGNFINYYNFHPPENRIKLLPKDIWPNDDPLIILDIGCNAGNLTNSLHNFLKEFVNPNCYVLGIDIDPLLVKRAQEQNTDDKIQYLCLDFMSSDQREAIISNYLCSFNVSKFSAVVCFSITMWIHLNHGDTGLKRFLNNIREISSMIIIEPQPWKCYKTAVRRMQLAKSRFEHFKQLQITRDVDLQIEIILLSLNGVSKILETDKTQWGRKILFFKVE